MNGGQGQVSHKPCQSQTEKSLCVEGLPKGPQWPYIIQRYEPYPQMKMPSVQQAAVS